MAIYSNTFHAAFHYDDFSSIVANPEVHLEELSIRKVMGFWWMDRPLAYLTLALNYYFGGLDPIGYHVVNIVIHIVSGILLYFFLYKTFTLPLVKENYGRTANWLALFSALLWLSNPVQTQAVTYIVQRMASIASMFYLFALLFFVKGRVAVGSRRWVYWLLTVISFFVSLGSKELALTLPFVIASYEVCFFRKGDIKRLLKERSTYLVLTIISLLIAAAVDLFNLTVYLPPIGTLLKQRVYTESRVIFYYITLLLFPLPERMSLDYDFPISYTLFAPISTLFSIATLLILLIYVAANIWRHPFLSFFILWFMITVSAEAVVVGLRSVFEHRLYLPSMAFFAPFAMTCFIIWEKGDWLVKRSLIALGVVVVIAYSINTYMRNFVWIDGYSVHLDSVRKYPGSIDARLSLGAYYLNAGMPDNAIEQLGRAKELNPREPEVRWYLGNSYYRKGLYVKAAEELELAVRLGAERSEVYGSLGDAYTKAGELEKAEVAYQRVVESASDRNQLEIAKAALESVRRMKKMEDGRNDR